MRTLRRHWRKGFIGIFGFLFLVIFAQNCSHGFQTEQFTQASVEGLSAIPQGGSTTPHAVVPTYLTTDAKSGVARHSIYVQVGNSVPIQVLLDTGSSGLRIYSSVLSSSTYTKTSTASSMSYGSGLQVNGFIADAVVTIGGVSTPQPIPIQVITSDNLNSGGNPILGGSTSSGVFGGFYGILGAKMSGATNAYSPFMALGSQKWIMNLAVPGQSTMGEIILNPTVSDLGGFISFQLSNNPPINRLDPPPSGNSTGWDDQDMNLCVNNLTSGLSVCQTGIMDSGANGIHELGDTSVTSVNWSTGNTAELVFTNSQGQTVTNQFTVGSVVSNAITLPSTGEPTGPGYTNTGQYPFSVFTVLYDDVNGVIGLKNR